MELSKPSTFASLCIHDPDFESDEDVNLGDIETFLTTKPNDFKRCKLVIERHDRGHAIPFDEPTLPIRINGRDDLCRAFPGETVCVEILTREGEIRTGRVVGVIGRESLPSFICKMMEGDHRMMIPISQAVTRIRLPPSKRPNTIETRKLNDARWVQEKFVDANEHQNHLFVVKVLKWKKTCFYPLGVVTQVLQPDKEKLIDALDTEYGLRGKPPSFKPMQTNHKCTEREDFCERLTFTINFLEAKDLGDAISVTDQGDTYQIGVHITDVASFVPKGSKVDEFARNQGEIFHGSEETTFMIEEGFSHNYLSLLQGKKRRAISLLVSINKQTNSIESHRFSLSYIKSDYQLSYQEAEKIIEENLFRQPVPLKFSSVEDCVNVVYCFSELCRKLRLAGNMSHKQLDGDRSHCMVEELMNMYNNAVADYIVSFPLTSVWYQVYCREESDRKLCTGNMEEPIESRNDDEDSGEDENEAEDVDNVESHVQEYNAENGQQHNDESKEHGFDNSNSTNSDIEKRLLPPEEFEVLKAVLTKCKAATKKRKHFTVEQQTASETILPNFVPAETNTRELLSKPVMEQSCSTPNSPSGDIDLQLDSYPQASAPMSRYYDIILQRLLHHVLHEDYTLEHFCECLTFTIDSSGAEDLDDAISVTDQGITYQIGVHITDVASFVPKGSEVDKFARKQGETFYRKDKTYFMIDRDLSSNYLSLREGQKRRAISLLIYVNKQTNEIESHRFALSCIKSDWRLSYQETDKIIQEHLKRESEPLKFSSVEECVGVAYRFSEMHRESRLAGGVSRVQCDRSRSHRMVEELMNMYNSAVADYLISSPLTRNLTPLRCHGPPDPEQLLSFKQKYQHFITLSSFLSQTILGEELDHKRIEENREDEKQDDFEEYENDVEELDTVESHQGDNDKNSEEYSNEPKQEHCSNGTNQLSIPENFEVFKAVLKKMEEATKTKDHFTLQRLMASDDIHPTLIHVEREFRELLSPPVILRSYSTLESRMGHFDLQLDSYTWASDPMRRYIDIVLQRLLHQVLCVKTLDASYKQVDIEQLCALDNFDRASDYTQNVEMLTQSDKQYAHMAVVDKLYVNGHDFWISFPLNSLLKDLSLMYKHLKVVDQPKYNTERNTITLLWRRRVYSFTDRGKNPVKTLGSKYITRIAVDTWQKMMSSVQNKNWDETEQCLKAIKLHSIAGEKGMDAETDEFHFKKLSLELRLGKVLPVQIGVGPGQISEVHLLTISPEFEVCLEHSKRPTTCFSKLALYPSKSEYKDYKEYQEIWGRLCKMDAAHNALEENNSVILEGVEIKWTSTDRTDMEQREGYFNISQAQKKDWAIEFDLSNCFLCIRLQNQHAEKNKDNEGEKFKDFTLQDPLPFTWVAHGIACRPPKKKNNQKDNSKPSIIQVHFYINYQSMKYIPTQICDKNTKFTVEVIPKNLPYVLREQAVANLTHANDLVQSIAVGKPPSSGLEVAAECSETLATVGEELGLPPLNTSQMNAVKEALHRPFTLIQGPPGTGKTVVGVHIVYQFLQRNQQDTGPVSDSMVKLNKDSVNGPPKKRAILYCGPSNKSVDIVAEQLLKLHRKGVLKLTRVYSEQMEMLEFPYPGSELKLCKQSLRDEKPRRELRSVSLMCQIRESSNPYSSEILRFDQDIKCGFLEENDIQKYKNILQQAKQHELREKDVILCTCAAALNPNFIKAMDFQQILIDECAMATEPEAFIPLVSHNPKQIVLLGDHKQLRPIVECPEVKEMGMKRSLFERYMDKALMLDTQYRMHKGICAFPSLMFYENQLKTAAKRDRCYLLTKNMKPTPILFGHVEAKEVSLVVSTTIGNENSKANPEEAVQAVRIARLLIEQSKVQPKNIAILTPYNAQVAEINKNLKETGIENLTACTIMKSQGSEWPYIIFSTVRTCEPSVLQDHSNRGKAWQAKYLGFITDPNQVNVAITRAQDGLCILGNHHLLRCNQLWGDLLTHYQSMGCVVDPAKDIKVLRRSSAQQ